MHSHSFQDTKFKLLTQVKDFQGQVVERLTILRYPRGLENKGLITQKNVNSTCIRPVFKIQSENFTGTSTTPSYGLRVGCRFYRTPGGVENKGLITQKRKFDMHLPSFQDTELKLHRYFNDSQVQVAGRLTILPYPRMGREERVNHSKNVNSTEFARHAMFSFAMTSGLASDSDKFKIIITLRRAQKFGDTGP